MRALEWSCAQGTVVFNPQALLPLKEWTYLLIY